MALGALALVAAAAAPARAGERDQNTLRTQLSTLVARPNGLRADDVAARAVATSFDLRQRREELLAAAAAVDQALVAYFPRLGLLARYARLSPIDTQTIGNVVVAPSLQGSAPQPITPGTVLVSTPVTFPVVLNQATLQASLQVPLLDLKIPGTHAAARHQRDAARWIERATARQVASDARTAYYTWARARLQTVVAEQALTQARGHLDSARHAFEVGAANKADVMRVEAQVAASELFVARARDFEAVLEEQLRTAMHDPRAARYEIGEDLQMELPAQPVGALDELVDEAWRGRAEVQVLLAAEHAQSAQAQVGRAGTLPVLTAFGDVVAADPNQRFLPQKDSFETTWDVGLQLTFSPNEAAVAALAARAAAAKARATAAQAGALRDKLRVEVMQAVEAVREADFAVSSTARGLDAAEESYRVRRDLYSNGRATSIELTDAETDLTQARLNAVGARIDQRIARIRLTHALGRDGDKARD
jgi:outer membrane protein TolC